MARRVQTWVKKFKQINKKLKKTFNLKKFKQQCLAKL
jgi:hypothetical protein